PGVTIRKVACGRDDSVPTLLDGTVNGTLANSPLSGAMEMTPTSRTPASARSSASSRDANAVRSAGVRYDRDGSERRATNTESGSKPSRTACSFVRLSSTVQAVALNATASAIWTTTTPARTRPAPAPTFARDPARSAACVETRSAIQSGTSANATIANAT